MDSELVEQFFICGHGSHLGVVLRSNDLACLVINPHNEPLDLTDDSWLIDERDIVTRHAVNILSQIRPFDGQILDLSLTVSVVSL